MAIIGAIETHYAQCRFRSRLEARWAVFFDHAFGNGQPGSGEWDYEPEGVVVSWRHRPMKYLPDFWLHTGQWAEIKGYLEPEKFLRLLAIANGLSDCGKGNDLVVFGDIPGYRSIRWPVQLHRHNGLWAVPWKPSPECPIPSKAIPEARITSQLLISGFPTILPEWAEEPMNRARKARFEWGESG
jgi:hypothetical protein